MNVRGLLVICVLTSRVTSAQQPATGEHKIGGVTFQANLRSRVEIWDWFRADSGDNNYAFSGSVLRFGFSKSADKWDWQAEFAAPLLLGLPSNAVAPGVQGQLGLGASYFAANQKSQNATLIFPKQLFWRWKNLGGISGQSLRIGRFEFADGSERAPQNATLAAIKRDRTNQRLIGSFGWSHIGRSFDGFQYALNKPTANFTVVGAIPTRGVFQVDGWGPNRTGYTYASYTRGWGRGSHTAETRVLAMYYQDWRHVIKTDSRLVAIRRTDLGNIRIGTFGGHHISAVTSSAGTVDVMLWGVAQAGRWGTLDHRAHAFAVEGGFQPNATGWLKAWKPWLRAGFSESSGDGNPNDKVHETFFQLLPTPRPFARFPFFNLMNTQDVNAALISRPHSRVNISSEFHALRLSNANDLWYAGGGVFQPWTFGYIGRTTSGAQSLGNLYDVSVDYRASTFVSVVAYFGYAQGLAAMSAVYPHGSNASFGYLEMTYRF